MARAMNRLLAIAVLALLGACASVVGPVENPRVSVTSLRILPASGGQQRFELGLKLMNPNGFDLKANGIVVDARLNDLPILAGAIAEPPVVPAYGEAEMKLPLSASLMDGIRLVGDLLRHPEDPLSYRLEVRIDLALPLSRRLTILEQGQIASRPPVPASDTATPL
ncbi:MAG: LEA type 2 family protein [Gammaproteobacteria bacterium]